MGLTQDPKLQQSIKKNRKPKDLKIDFKKHFFIVVKCTFKNRFLKSI